MSDGKSKILVLVEGAKTDVKLMQKLFEVYGISERYEILSYNTNIYTLYREMFSDGDPSSIDTLQNLKEHERDAEKKKLFDNRYSDILLIFDLDPQDPQFSGDKITEMACIVSGVAFNCLIKYYISIFFPHCTSIHPPQRSKMVVHHESGNAWYSIGSVGFS